MARYAKSLGFAQRSTAPATPAEGNVEMYMLDDGKMYQRDSSGTVTEIGGGSGGGGITDILYADLITAIGADGLIAGSLYCITDFATRHYIVDGDGNRYSGTGNEITGVTEPLIVLATSTNTISHETKSTLYPQDIIYYDWNPANWMDDLSFADADNEPATAIISGFKGVIYFRHDTLLDNYCGYDFRNVKFRRWKETNESTDYTSIYSTAYDFMDYLTFNPTVTSYETSCKGNHVEGYKDTYSEWFTSATLLGNNVFHLDSNNGLTTNNTVMSGSCNNTIGADFYNNIIGTGFCDNTVGSVVYNNTIGADFHSNTVASYFHNNTIGAGFYSNTVASDFHNNTIGADFNSNTIGNSFKYNKVHDNITSVNFTSATHVYEDYNCTLFINASGVAKLSYYNASDVLTVVAANA